MRLLYVHPGASFSTADVYNGYGDALASLGHNVFPYRLDKAIDETNDFMQWRWRRARHKQPEASRPEDADLFYNANVWMLEAALRIEADWVLIVSGMYAHPDVLTLMVRAGLKVALLLTESPYNLVEERALAPYAHVVFTNEQACVEDLRKANRNTFYLPHAYNPKLHYPAPAQLHYPHHDVVFVGSGFEERIELLSAIDWSGIDFGLYGTWTLLGSRHPLRKHLKDDVIPNSQAAELYRAAKIGLNIYRTSKGFGRNTEKIERAVSLNPRAYELAACGAFSLASERDEYPAFFGEHVPMFFDARDLQYQLRYYLACPERRAEHAAALPELVAPHTYTDRARVLVSALEAYNRAAAA